MTQTHVPSKTQEKKLQVKDPVCGMDVDPKTAKYKAERQGTTYYFCSAECKQKFEANPSQYVSAA